MLQLGMQLFCDRRLSSTRTVSCATCHKPSYGFADSRRRSTGASGRPLLRTTPSLLNVGLLPRLFWDGRVSTLEEQVQYPILGPAEMGTTKLEAERAVEAAPEYSRLFAEAFGSDVITFDRIVMAIVAFERSLSSVDTPFDRYTGGSRSALTESAVRGLSLFTGKARCADCHRLDGRPPLFTDARFHRTRASRPRAGDAGRYGVTQQPRDWGRFRTPTLRNVALRPAYMHDGIFSTLRDVIAFYAGRPIAGERLDPSVRPANLTDAEQQDLLAFLESLTDPRVRRPSPWNVSGECELPKQGPS